MCSVCDKRGYWYQNCFTRGQQSLLVVYRNSLKLTKSVLQHSKCTFKLTSYRNMSLYQLHLHALVFERIPLYVILFHKILHFSIFFPGLATKLTHSLAPFVILMVLFISGFYVRALFLHWQPTTLVGD